MDPKKSSQVSAFTRLLRKYLHDYGGVPAIVWSPFFFAALAGALLTVDRSAGDGWRSVVLQTIPNLLGFSLGTYALLFTLISPSLREALQALQNKRGVSYFDEMNATFLHFIFMQVIAFTWALFSESSVFTQVYESYMVRFPPSCRIDAIPFLRGAGNFIGSLIFIYSFVLVIAASLTVYRIARFVGKEG